MLLAALPSVAVAAQHLAVVRDRASAFHPRGYMVGFHNFDVKRVAAYSTLATLSLINFAARVGIKSTYSQMAYIAVKDICKDA